MLKDHKELIQQLNAHGVEYLIVGGHAVSLYAEPRGTKDLDVFIRANKKNSEAVFAALADYGAPLVGVTPQDFNAEPTTIFQIGVEPGRVDLLQGIAGVSFDEAWERRTDTSLDDGTLAHFISRADLIRNKSAVGRHQDLADIEKLRES